MRTYVRPGSDTLGGGGTIAYAQGEPVLDRADSCRSEELEARTRRYTSPYRDVVRAKLVLLAAQGVANDIIAARLDLPRQVVSNWRKRFWRNRLPGLEELPRGGRPARFSPPESSSPSRPSRVSCPRNVGGRWHAGR